jgi:hypothetical protein
LQIKRAKILSNSARYLANHFGTENADGSRNSNKLLGWVADKIAQKGYGRRRAPARRRTQRGRGLTNGAVIF